MFSLSSIDPVLFSTFLILTLIVGLSYGYRVKNLREYAIGNKNFSTATITSTIVATWVGGGFMFYTLSNTYTTGLHFAISIAGASLGLLFTGQLFSTGTDADVETIILITYIQQTKTTQHTDTHWWEKSARAPRGVSDKCA